MTETLLIPVRSHAAGQGRFHMPPEWTVAAFAEASPELEQLSSDLRSRGMRLRSATSGDAQLRITRDRSVAGREAYRLVITPDRIEIRASAPPGAYYGVQTLRALLRDSQDGTLRTARIDDAPDFARRGVSLDVSRGRVPTLRRLMQLVEQLAHWKCNELQLYIENVFRFRRHPEIGRGYNPFTADDIRGLQDHCRRHHMRLVGSFASFGHMEKILQLPRYKHLGEMQGYRDWPGGTTLCPHDPGSIRLIEELYEEYLPLFEAEDFNICGDEPWELGQGRSVVRVRWFGMDGVYSGFLRKLYEVCRKHGKRANAWADVALQHPRVLKQIPRDMVMLNWDYDPDGKNIGRTREIVDRGLPVVVCPGTHAWLAHGSRLDYGIRNIERFAGEGLACGAEGLLNTDWGDNSHRNLLAVSMHNLAWGAAHAWCHKGTTQKGFTERFCRHTFGIADPAFGKAIHTLGMTFPTPKKHRNLSFLYSMLCPSIQAGFEYMEFAIDTLPYIRNKDLEAQAARLRELRWPELPAGAEGGNSSFLSELLQEYAVATQLDHVACMRALALKAEQESKSVPARTWKALIELTQETSEELRRVWRLGNRPSRLSELLASIGHTVKEYQAHLRA